MRYITLQEVIRIHDVMIKRYGGSEGVRDLGLIDAAVARPKAGFGDHEAYADIFLKAAVLLHSLIKNHGFVDGNKRTAVTACGTFLLVNGYKLAVAQNELVEFAVSIAEGTILEPEIAEWIQKNSQPAT